MKITENAPANPFFKWNEAGYGDSITIYDENGGKQHIAYQEGLTIRQYFASMAMQGIISNTKETRGIRASCNLAVQIADALITELNKTDK
jgi:hypothetical protein